MPKRNHLTLTEKGSILDELAAGIDGKRIALNRNVAESTVSRIKSNKENIRKLIANSDKGTGARKYITHSAYPEIEEKLYDWLLDKRAKHIPVSRKILQEKGKALFDSIHQGNKSFSASDGWFANFRKRYGLRYLAVCGEILSACPENVAPFKCKLEQKIKSMDLTNDQIYNADETGLYWKMLPNKTYVSAAEKTAPGRKLAKDRITFLACTNASGTHKVTPLVIGKSKKPRCFRGFDLPLNYDNSKSAWMNVKIFKKWFHEFFVPEVSAFQTENNLPIGALLLLDNAPSHPDQCELVSSDGKIAAMYMPPNVTPLIQPMDQNIIKVTKLAYRNALLSSVLAQPDIELGQALKNFTLKQAIINLSNAWASVTQSIIVSSWTKILNFSGNDDEYGFEAEDDVSLAQLAQENQSSAPEASEMEQNIILMDCQNLLNAVGQTDHTLQDIYEWNMDNVEESEDSESEEEEREADVSVSEITIEKVSHQNAISAFNVAIKWAEQNNKTISEITMLQNLRDSAVKQSLTSTLKQTKINVFFSSK